MNGYEFIIMNEWMNVCLTAVSSSMPRTSCLKPGGCRQEDLAW